MILFTPGLTYAPCVDLKIECILYSLCLIILIDNLWKDPVGFQNNLFWLWLHVHSTLIKKASDKHHMLINSSLSIDK